MTPMRGAQAPGPRAHRDLPLRRPCKGTDPAASDGSGGNGGSTQYLGQALLRLVQLILGKSKTVHFIWLRKIVFPTRRAVCACARGVSAGFVVMRSALLAGLVVAYLLPWLVWSNFAEHPCCVPVVPCGAVVGVSCAPQHTAEEAVK